jgi:TolA-binding protein
MLKQGLAFYALKDKKTGKIILEKLIQKYPDTEQAQLAQKKIRKPAVPKKNN